MTREDFKEIRSKLEKGSRVRIRLERARNDIPAEFTASVKTHGPSYVEVGIKGIRGLKFLIFTQIAEIEIIASATPSGSRSAGRGVEQVQ
jgi:hypothetical protein